MAITNFPTDTEITNIANEAGYSVFFRESPVSSSKWNNWNTGVQQLVNFLKNGTSPQFTQESWINATLQNSWVNGSGLDPASYMKESTGRVWIRGTIANGTKNVAAFTLPIGYRPQFSHLYPCTVIESITYSAMSILINSSGEVIPQDGPTAGANDTVPLTNISFNLNL